MSKRTSLPSGVIPIEEAARRLWGMRPSGVRLLGRQGHFELVDLGRRLGVRERSLTDYIAKVRTFYGVAVMQRCHDEEAGELHGESPLGPRLDEEPVYLRTREDGLQFAAASWRKQPAGAHLVIGADDDARVRLILGVEPDTPLPQLVESLAAVALPGEALWILSNRRGEVPADRPDDEIVWEEMRGAADAHRIQLLDWMISAGRFAFSAAEHAPSPAGWAEWETQHRVA
jgi:hypothetical protein